MNIALLSFAHEHANRWAKAIKRSPDAKLVVIWDENEERGEKKAKQYETSFSLDLDKVLARPDVDAVGICAETNRHAELTIAASEAGKHILCEKPMATTLEDCDRMIEACKRAGIKYMQSFPLRFDPASIKIKDLLQRSAIGKVATVRKRHGHYFALIDKWMGDSDAEWLRDSVKAGGGAFLDEGIHAADYLRWMFGDPISVNASIDILLTNIKVDDNGVAIYRFPGKVIGILQSSWTDLAATNTVEIYGEKGMIIQRYSDCASTRIMGEVSKPLMVYSQSFGERGWHVYDLPLNFKVCHEVIALRFIECISKDLEPSVTGVDGKKALEMILGAYQSAKEDKTIYFPLQNSSMSSDRKQSEASQ